MTLKHRLRKLAWQVAPEVMADRARNHERRLRERTGVTAFGMRIADETGGQVRTGVAAGLRYPPERLFEVDAPGAKLAGTYECEIAHVFDRAFDEGVRDFVDVGCADGYFAVGIAVARPGVHVHAWDLSRSARRMCSDLARENGVADRISIGSRFDPTLMSSVAAQPALVLMDVEGAEVDLLIPATASNFENHHVLVEVHEDQVPGARERLVDAMTRTHDADVILQDAAARRRVPGVEFWSDDDHRRSGDGFRGPKNHWVHFAPR